MSGHWGRKPIFDYVAKLLLLTIAIFLITLATT